MAGQPGLLEWISRLSLTQTLRTFEQGLLSFSLLLGIVAGICGFTALSAVWLHPGQRLQTKLTRSVICVAMNYHVPLQESSEAGQARIARYALGDDYHEVLKKRLHVLADKIREVAPEAQTRAAEEAS